MNDIVISSQSLMLLSFTHDYVFPLELTSVRLEKVSNEVRNVYDELPIVGLQDVERDPH